jgi:hypothetical protein
VTSGRGRVRATKERITRKAEKIRIEKEALLESTKHHYQKLREEDEEQLKRAKKTLA